MEAEGVDHSFEKFGRESQERKGSELEGVAESSKGFLDKESGRKGRGACGHQGSICL